MFASCKELSRFVIGTLIVIGMFTIIPVMMIVYGARNPTVACVSPCILQECNMPGNAPYILPTPPIGISVQLTLIIGGVIGIILEVAFTIFAMRHKKDNFWTLLLLVPSIPFLAAVSWMIVSFIVYTQTIELCTTYNALWSVDMTALKWLLGANIGGMIFLVGPYVIPYVLIAITAPCSNKPIDCQQFNLPACVCPCILTTCIEIEPEHTESVI
jgi:hypothetical protein